MNLNSHSEQGLFQDAAQPYDALLIVSFGGPEGMDEVIPFLENVLRGRNVPRERLLEVAHHYELFGGVSPINGQNRALIAALEADFAAHDLHLPIYWGNRNWHPYLTDTLCQMAKDSVGRAIAFFTSTYSSYSGCRQYREDIARAQAEVGSSAPHIDKLRMAYNHPLFIEANAENLSAALDQIPGGRRRTAAVAFTAHSIPSAMAQNCRYEAQLRETCRLVAGYVGRSDWQLVYQSQSGSPRQPWLGPDILEYLRMLKGEGVEDIVVMPIGFVSDHMEVRYDLDTEAQQLAKDIGLNMVRAATVGTNPLFVTMIRELILERIAENPARSALGQFGASHDICPADCCLPGA